MGICERLRSERERLGLSQMDCGERCGVGKQAQLRYEKGERHPDSLYMAAFAGIGADVLYVLTGQRSVPLESRLSEAQRLLLKHHAMSLLDGRHTLEKTALTSAINAAVRGAQDIAGLLLDEKALNERHAREKAAEARRGALGHAAQDRIAPVVDPADFEADTPAAKPGAATPSVRSVKVGGNVGAGAVVVTGKVRGGIGNETHHTAKAHKVVQTGTGSVQIGVQTGGRNIVKNVRK